MSILTKLQLITKAVKKVARQRRHYNRIRNYEPMVQRIPHIEFPMNMEDMQANLRCPEVAEELQKFRVINSIPVVRPLNTVEQEAFNKYIAGEFTKRWYEQYYAKDVG